MPIVSIVDKKMAILHDSVIFNGFLFFLSTLILWITLKYTKNYIKNKKTKKNINLIIYVLFIGMIIFIFDNHTSHYLNNL